MAAYNQKSNLNNNIWIPGWWIAAYESLCCCSPLEHPMSVSIRSKIFPAFTANRLKSLSIVLSKLQQRIIEPDDVFEIVGDGKRRCIAHSAKNAIYETEKAMQDVIALRILVKNGACQVDGYESVPIFEQALKIRKGKGEELVVTPQLADLGGQILIGYGEPYSDLVRVAAKKISVRDVLGNMPPLALWRSVWLDLQGSELSLFLCLEKAMQWERRYLTFDGAFGCALSDMVGKLPTVSGVKKDKIGLRERILLLEKFGKKLVDHGVIRHEGGDKYLAFGQSSVNQTEIVWDSSIKRHLDDEEDQRFGKYSSYLYNNVFKKTRNEVIGLLLEGSVHVSKKDVISRIWEEIESRFNTDLSRIVSVVSGNLIMMAGPLFLEWGIRGANMSRYPLPEEIRRSIAEFSTSFESSGDVADKFEKYLDYLRENGKVLEDILCMKMSTIVDPSTRAGMLEEKIEKNIRVDDQVEIAKVLTKTACDKTIPQVVDKKSEGNLKKKISDELTRIREKQPDRYRVIKQTYLDALDQQSRKIVHEVQKRLQPHVFDQQLRNSLVKFLIENPALFKEKIDHA